MRGHLATLGLLALLACSREMVEVRTDATPEYLGRFSGVYEGIDTGLGTTGRTLVVQFRDKILISPIDRAGDGYQLSKFVSVLEVADEGADTLSFDESTALILPVSQNVAPTASCTNDLELGSVQEFFATFVSCFSGPCTVPCIVPNVYDFAASAKGECIDGTWCRFEPFEFAGRLGRDALELYFKDPGLSPPTRDVIDCDGDYARCVRLLKVCDFDSRLAGVYHLESTYNPDESTLEPPADLGNTQTLEIAMAVAHYLPVMAVFGQDPLGHDRLFFGRFDPFTLEFTLDDGKDPGDAAWRFRNPGVGSLIDGVLLEDEERGLVQVDGSYTLTAGADEAVFDMQATRQSGSIPGIACSPLDRCGTPDPECPLGTSQPMGQSLTLTSGFNDGGCLETTCERDIDAAALCGPLPDCGGLPVSFGEARRFEMLDWQLSCPGGGDGCAPQQRCAEAQCAADVDLLKATVIDDDCTGPVSLVHLSYTKLGTQPFLDVRCTP